MQQILDDIKATKGIAGLFIANLKGHVAAHTGDFSTSTPTKLAEEVLKFVQTTYKSKEGEQWLQFYYNNRTVLLFIQKDFFVFILSQLSNDAALIRLTTEVALSSIRSNKKMIRRIIDA